MRKSIKIVLSVVAVVLVAVIIWVAVILIQPYYERKQKREDFEIANVDTLEADGDYIHFLNTGSSDAILLESDGHFALIDAAEDSDNPRGFDSLDLTGYEDYVLAYLKEYAGDEDGKVHLDFILGTHCHSDHIGGFDTIIYDDDVTIDKAYLKVYDSSKIISYEVNKWDNQEVYDQMVEALNSKDIPIISDIPSESFTFGNFTITFYNTVDGDAVGENDQSVGTLIEKDGIRVFLAADIDNLSGDEDNLGPEIGDVDLLKVGHHSYLLSTSGKWLRNLDPEVCIVTNSSEKATEYTLSKITRIADASILMTVDENGIIVELGDDGTMTYYNNTFSVE